VTGQSAADRQAVGAAVPQAAVPSRRVVACPAWRRLAARLLGVASDCVRVRYEKCNTLNDLPGNTPK